MSTDIGPGDYVECIDGSPHNGWVGAPGIPTPPTKGSIYVVDDVLPASPNYPEPTITLVGWPPTPPGIRHRGRLNKYTWRISRFRKVYRPDAKLKERLIANIPQHIKDEELT